MPRFTGTNIAPLKHQYPSRIEYGDTEARTAFIGWTTEAIENHPMNESAKVVVDAMVAGKLEHFAIACVDGFLEWVRLASEYHALDEKASRMVTTFANYRDQLVRYQSQIRNYWM